jgi:2'-5' RNA ligase
MAGLGWQPERRPFRAHLTLGRVKDVKPAASLALPWGRQVDAPSFAITAVTLYQSVLRPEGAVYTVRHRAALGGQAS